MGLVPSSFARAVGPECARGTRQSCRPTSGIQHAKPEPLIQPSPRSVSYQPFNSHPLNACTHSETGGGGGWAAKRACLNGGRNGGRSSITVPPVASIAFALAGADARLTRRRMPCEGADDGREGDLATGGRTWYSSWSLNIVWARTRQMQNEAIGMAGFQKR